MPGATVRFVSGVKHESCCFGRSRCLRTEKVSKEACPTSCAGHQVDSPSSQPIKSESGSGEIKHSDTIISTVAVHRVTRKQIHRTYEALQWSAKRGQQAIASALWTCKTHGYGVPAWDACWDPRATSIKRTRLEPPPAELRKLADGLRLQQRALPETRRGMVAVELVADERHDTSIGRGVEMSPLLAPLRLPRESPIPLDGLMRLEVA